MRLLNARLSSIGNKTMLCVTAAFVIGTALYIGPLASANPTVASSQCTIKAEMEAMNVQLDSALPPGLMVAAAHSNLERIHPGSRVVEEQAGRAHSAQLPIVQNHDVLVARVEGEGDMPIGGPVGKPGDAPQVVMGSVSCAIAVYDSDTGEFLVEWQVLTPRP